MEQNVPRLRKPRWQHSQKTNHVMWGSVKPNWVLDKAVYVVVNRAVHGPRHPALRDFLSDATRRTP